MSQLISALISQLYTFLLYIQHREGVSVTGNSFQPSHAAFVIKIMLIKVCHGSQSLSANEHWRVSKGQPSRTLLLPLLCSGLLGFSAHTPDFRTHPMFANWLHASSLSSMSFFFLYNKFFPDYVSASKSNKKAVPDLVKLTTGTSDCFPDYSNHSSLQAVPSPPLFFSMSKTHGSKDWEILGQFYFSKANGWEKKPVDLFKLLSFLHIFWQLQHLQHHVSRGSPSRLRKLLLWSLEHLLDDNTLWKRHHALNF